ncbi:GPT1 putative polyamine transporter [Candida maltosa Xu316]
MNIKSILSGQNITINVDHAVDDDEAKLLAMGFTQEFKRDMGAFEIFAVSFSVLGLLPSIAACFDYQQLVIGMSPLPWIIAMLPITAVALSMAEISSVYPCSAGTPYAVSQLAPPKFRAYLTWFTSWSNWMCQITAAPSVSYSCASLMLALKAFADPSYSPSNAEVFGLSCGVMIVSAFMCMAPTKWAGRFGSIGTILNIMFLIIVFVMILAGNKRDEMHDGLSRFNSNSTAWGLYNQTPFPQGISFLISFMGVIWAMSGYDSPFHLSEECSNPTTAVPLGITMTSVLGGVIGFLFMIAISYTLVSIDDIAADPDGLGQPFVTYLTQIMDKKLVMAATALTAVSSFFMAQNCLLAASRVTYAYSRDGLLPLSNIWKKVSRKTQTPINAVIANCILGILFLLLGFAGDTAIGAIFSCGAIAGFVSFTTPTLLKITYARNTFVPGPWNLGKFSKPIGWLSVAFVAMMIPLLCFPWTSGKDLNVQNMNWTVLVYFGPMVVSSIWFFVDARKWYVGPRSNINPDDIIYGQQLETGEEIPDILDGEKISISSTEKK